jgi:hypothetical protein
MSRFKWEDMFDELTPDCYIPFGLVLRLWMVMVCSFVVMKIIL